MKYKLKRTWTCKKCNDGECSVSRQYEDNRPIDFHPPRMVRESICLVGWTTFKDAQWEEEHQKSNSDNTLPRLILSLSRGLRDDIYK